MDPSPKGNKRVAASKPDGAKKQKTGDESIPKPPVIDPKETAIDDDKSTNKLEAKKIVPESRRSKPKFEQVTTKVYLALDIYCNRHKSILQIGCFSPDSGKSLQIPLTPPKTFQSDGAAFLDAFHVSFDKDGRLKFIKEGGWSVVSHGFIKALHMLTSFLGKEYQRFGKLTLVVYSCQELAILVQQTAAMGPQGIQFLLLMEEYVLSYVVFETYQTDHMKAFLPLDKHLGRQVDVYSADKVAELVREVFLKERVLDLLPYIKQFSLLRDLPPTQIPIRSGDQHLRLNSFRVDTSDWRTADQIAAEVGSSKSQNRSTATSSLKSSTSKSSSSTPDSSISSSPFTDHSSAKNIEPPKVTSTVTSSSSDIKEVSKSKSSNTPKLIHTSENRASADAKSQDNIRTAPKIHPCASIDQSQIDGLPAFEKRTIKVYMAIDILYNKHRGILQIGAYCAGDHSFHAACLPTWDFQGLDSAVQKHFNIRALPKNLLNPDEKPRFKFIREDGTLVDTPPINNGLNNLQRFLEDIRHRYKQQICLVFYSMVEAETFAGTADAVRDTWTGNSFLCLFTSIARSFVVLEGMSLCQRKALPPLDVRQEGTKPVYSADKVAKLVREACIKVECKRLISLISSSRNLCRIYPAPIPAAPTTRHYLHLNSARVDQTAWIAEDQLVKAGPPGASSLSAYKENQQTTNWKPSERKMHRQQFGLLATPADVTAQTDQDSYDATNHNTDQTVFSPWHFDLSKAYERRQQQQAQNDESFYPTRSEGDFSEAHQHSTIPSLMNLQLPTPAIQESSIMAQFTAAEIQQQQQPHISPHSQSSHQDLPLPVPFLQESKITTQQDQQKEQLSSVELPDMAKKLAQNLETGYSEIVTEKEAETIMSSVLEPTETVPTPDEDQHENQFAQTKETENSSAEQENVSSSYTKEKESETNQPAVLQSIKTENDDDEEIVILSIKFNTTTTPLPSQSRRHVLDQEPPKDNDLETQNELGINSTESPVVQAAASEVADTPSISQAQVQESNQPELETDKDISDKLKEADEEIERYQQMLLDIKKKKLERLKKSVEEAMLHDQS